MKTGGSRKLRTCRDERLLHSARLRIGSARVWMLTSITNWQVETAGPQYNIFQLLFGVSVHDAGALPTAQDFTISFSCQFV